MHCSPVIRRCNTQLLRTLHTLHHPIRKFTPTTRATLSGSYTPPIANRTLKVVLLSLLSVILFLMIRHPPISTLFPYPTLFFFFLKNPPPTYIHFLPPYAVFWF